MNNIMIDLETFDTSPTSLILSIGAVEFDESGLGETFHVHVEPESCLEAGLTIGPRTVFWWMEQSEEARMKIVTAQRIQLRSALAQLADKFDWQGKKVWCNGASFDFPILKYAYEKLGLRLPWQYWNEHDYRTMKNIVPKHVFADCKVEATVSHDALADAISQAETLIALMGHLKVAA